MSKGVDSIRLRGKRIGELPLGTGNEAIAQLPDAIKQERLNNIATINAKFPTLRIDYIDSRIVECRENIDRVNDTKTAQATMIEEYTGLIAQCEHRDKVIAGLDSSQPTHETKVKALKKAYPPYNVDAMRSQIVQCKEAIVRCDDVVRQEHDSITEFSEARALCVQRDKELAQYGAVAEGS